MTLIISNEDVSRLLTMEDTIAVLEDAYSELYHGRAVTRRRSDCLTPTASRDDATYGFKTMDGVVPSQGVAAVRLNSDIVTWPTVDGNQRRVKVPAAPNERWVGLILLFSTNTGEPLAIMPDGVVQRFRVGPRLDTERLLAGERVTLECAAGEADTLVAVVMRFGDPAREDEVDAGKRVVAAEDRVSDSDRVAARLAFESRGGEDVEA